LWRAVRRSEMAAVAISTYYYCACESVSPVH
jgi:hypothetical protein